MDMAPTREAYGSQIDRAYAMQTSKGAGVNYRLLRIRPGSPRYIAKISLAVINIQNPPRIPLAHG